jgi:hypothetical protein
MPMKGGALTPRWIAGYAYCLRIWLLRTDRPQPEGHHAGTFAHRFTNWVFREVIPSIRKTGSYGVPFAFLNDHSKRKAADKKASKRGKDLQACKGEKSA